MARFVVLDSSKLTPEREIDDRLVSYNVEMTEVTGGTFWKAYTEAQIDGTEEFPVIKDWSNMSNLQQWYEPIDTKNPRLIKLAKELGTVFRVRGQTRPIMILMVNVTARLPRDFRTFLLRSSGSAFSTLLRRLTVNCWYLSLTARVYIPLMSRCPLSRRICSSERRRSTAYRSRRLNSPMNLT